MKEFVDALQAVLTIVLLIALGYTLQKKGKITDAIGAFLSFFVVNITLPCSIFKTVTTSVTADKIEEMPMYVAVIVISQLLSILVALIIIKYIKIPQERRGSFITMTAFNNTLFMGMPVSIALFGEENSSIILYYYVASAILFWTIGARLIAGKRVKGKINIPKPFLGLVAGIIVVFVRTYFFELEFPVFIQDTVKYIATLTTPLSMIFTGFALGQFGIRNIRFDKCVCVGLLGRFIVSPVIFIFAISLLPIDHISKSVFIVQAFMPVQVSQTIIARQYGVDDKYPAVMVTISTILSLLIIPLVKVIL